jgi:dihydroflavonol-4-reductase
MCSILSLPALVAARCTQYIRPARQLINVEGTRNVLDACVRSGVRRLVYCSSVVAVGALDTCPAAPLSAGGGLMDETFEYNMRAHRLGYFDTKREAEELVLAFARSQTESHAATLTTAGPRSAPLDIVVLCPSNVYGRGDALKASRGTQVKVARGRLPFYSGGGINIVRVQDVAEAFVAAWHKGMRREDEFRVFNLIDIPRSEPKSICSSIKPVSF